MACTLVNGASVSRRPRYRQMVQASKDEALVRELSTTEGYQQFYGRPPKLKQQAGDEENVAS